MAAKSNLVVVDGNYLCYRAFHTTGMLRHNDNPTGVLYGFFVAVRTLAGQLGSRRFAFCFDYGRPKRLDAYPDYKRKRKERKLDPDEAKAFASLRDQVDELRDHLLPEVGFGNVFKAAGYEADDLIAKVVSKTTATSFDRQSLTIVSGDADLYQLLSEPYDVTIWDPVKRVMKTETWFRNEFGIAPSQWPEVKAGAGCGSDGIAGIKGVGEIGMCKYLTKKIDPDSAKFKLIAGNQELIQRNLELVRLPYAGCPELELADDYFDHEKWVKVAQRLGFRSVPKLFDTAGFGLGAPRR